MGNIGYSSPDWGMGGWYDREDHRRLMEEQEERNADLYRPDCYAIAMRLAPGYIEAADGEDYDTESWREWLADETAWESQEVNDAMLYWIEHEEWFTRSCNIGLMAAEFEQQQKAAAGKEAA